jgi:leucyl/phenylalanyl-tRNA--protein transferase
LEFPEASQADPDGLLAVGGDLSVARLLRAYASGIFPWSDSPITWWSPDPRAIFEIETFTPPRRLSQKMRSGHFSVTFDQVFSQVIQNCAAPAPGREETWISPHFIEAYQAMHRAGHAHSTEVWWEGRLVGGLYGVALGSFFAGESMFHHVSDASKIALTATIQHLRQQGFLLFDTQVATPATTALGAIEIPRQEYLERLKKALQTPQNF